MHKVAFKQPTVLSRFAKFAPLYERVQNSFTIAGTLAACNDVDKSKVPPVNASTGTQPVGYHTIHQHSVAGVGQNMGTHQWAMLDVAFRFG